MHYYKRNIGDYAKKAGRLTMLQHGAYTLLLDACYDRERFPTMEEAIDWTWASSPAEIEAVQFVLARFFKLEDGVYVQTRIQEEIDEYRVRSATNSRIAQERETKRREKSTKRGRSVHEPSPVDHESPPNQEPITNKPPISPKGDDRFEKFWSAYPKKVGKDAARKRFEQRKPNEELLSQMLGAIELQRRSEQWTRDGGQYIPNPATWLSQGRWQDGQTATTSTSIGVHWV